MHGDRVHEGSRGVRCSALLDRLLEGSIHLLKSPFGPLIEGVRKEWYKNPPKPLHLRETHLIPAGLLDPEGMLSVKQPGKSKVTHPSQLLPGRNRTHRRLKGHRLSTRRKHTHLEPGTGSSFSRGFLYEWIPLPVPSEIRKDRPDAFRGTLDENIHFDDLHVNAPKFSLAPPARQLPTTAQGLPVPAGASASEVCSGAAVCCSARLSLWLSSTPPGPRPVSPG